MPSKWRPGGLMYALVIQGGAMRSVYCLGAVRALRELNIDSKVGSVHSSSAGCISAAVLLGEVANDPFPYIGDKIHELVRIATSKRFFNSRRYQKMMDVDYLMQAIRDVTGLSLRSLRNRSIVFEVALTNARTAAASYLDVSTCDSDNDLYEALRATMAIPILYHRRVTLYGEQYIDGGIADPLPLIRALRMHHKPIIAISSVGRATLGAAKSGMDEHAIRRMPGISSAVRNLMLTTNPLAQCAESLMELGFVRETPIIRITPSRPELLGSRVETNTDRLLALESLGYEDGMEALS